MLSVDVLIARVNEEFGIGLQPADADVDLADLAEWDSVHLLRLVALLEHELDRVLPVHDIIGARSLRAIWAAAMES
ncbi:hypothetical protein SRB5_17800 [Streptomyces sp. RB5]|uniref:Carrier domain-containing protein n=1 Tax=Streptomyces smaragdinus TaxID=2585196 RepID=A0A7K0CDX8_9ACTN|nr:acyl carrier protein [Streptomyces smaragdinus]MQY11661.1 hypothetical protein [Streptomyces smaragdinus]